ncbi:hypothetical protein B0H16DRAFT_1557678 [Mycena metata]|uniref:C2H2-type domain-containing protein n=1 Tax=Mycena metata TaxID=1033252 RepID=A0AAD7IN70_9AGAR|nr:hypothetical protein B0H16DRAFT_1557678 [Mycena metata]
MPPLNERCRPSDSLPFPDCPKTFKSTYGRTNHCNTVHVNPNTIDVDPVGPELSPEPPSPGAEFGDPQTPPRASASPTPPLSPNGRPCRRRKIFHRKMNGVPCDRTGAPYPRRAPPLDPPLPWTTGVPSRTRCNSKRQIFCFSVSRSMGAITHETRGDLGPYDNYQQLYAAIDSIGVGDAPWKCFKTTAIDPRPDAPDWARQEYEIWYRDPDTVIRNMLDNPDFAGEFDTTPYIELDATGQRRWSDFMSGNFAWKHCDQIISDDPTCKGSMYVPAILGADKTTVSVATGNVEYHPCYISIGNIRNNVRRAHRNGVVPVAFFAIPKTERKYDNDPAFRKFKRQLYHASLSAILSTLKPGMTTPVIRRCPDGHFRRVIYDLGPFIADYPEQVLLAGTVQNWCPKCTALPSDLEGFATRRSHDHSPIRSWTNGPFTYDFPRADIHELLSSDLLHQTILSWVEDYLNIVHPPALANSILDEIDRRIAATPQFPCLRRFKHGRRFKQWTGDDSKALMKIYLPAVKEFIPPQMVRCFSSFLDFCYIVRRPDFDESSLDSVDAAIRVFRDTGVRENFSLPRQHSLVHYRPNIELFGAPGGLCSSITESRHITAVKKPWRRSSRYNALGQMLVTLQRLDKLAGARADFVDRGMVAPDRMPDPSADKDVEDDDGGEVDDARVEGNVMLARRRERKYPLTCDPSGIRGMRRERIRCTPRWRKIGPRRDCAFVVEDQKPPLLFSFQFDGVNYPCALGAGPRHGMWMVRPDLRRTRARDPVRSVVHLDTILRGAHLIPCLALDIFLSTFEAFFVNKYIDAHANEIAF